MKTYDMKHASFVVLAFVFLLSPASAQDRDQIRQQAEEQLSKMTPEEIDRKLKEFGLSRWEAINRASDIGLTLEQYLSKTLLETPRMPESMRDTVRVSRLPETRWPAVAVRRERVVIPGFTGRYGIDTTIRPFGYDLFEFPGTTFEPPLSVATPPTYVLGPADELTVSVWGETRLNYQVVVNREGNVLIPDVGPVSANGQTIQNFRTRLLRRMTAVYSGLRNGAPDANTFLDVSLGKLRSIQIFVVGEVKRPGGYVTSSMSTVFHSLFLAGGPTVNGTLRHISVVRGGTQLPEVDVYDYLVLGDRSKDLRLEDGDIIFISPARKRVAMIGNVIRPAVYEIGDKEVLKDLLKMAGGARFDTDLRRVHIERIIPFDQRQQYVKDVLEIDLKFESMPEFQKDTTPLRDGDIVAVFKISNLPENRVYISGHVNKPGPFQLKPGMRIRDLVMEADSLKRGAFMERGLLFRMLPNLRRETVPFVPWLVMEGDEKHNLTLENEDSVVVFSELEFRPVNRVGITGAVRSPSYYPRHENMTLHDLVMLAGGLQESAELTGWEISRLDTTNLGIYAKIIKVNNPFGLETGVWVDSLYLKDFDYVFIPFNPRFQVQKFIDLQGYVMYPGPYPIRYEGEKLADIIKRAGGLRPGAYLEGSKIFRRGAVGDIIQKGQIPIDFRNALTDQTSRDNIVLYARDSVYISYLEDVVRVSGEVFVPSAILYRKGEDIDYYIEQAGGFTDEADEGRAYAFLPGGKKWESGDLLPGSQIFVPKRIEREDKVLPLLRDLSTILASLAAITIAIVQVTK